MDQGLLACLDVYYGQQRAKACAVVFRLGPQEHIVAEYCATVGSIQEYVPGEFYRRELPGLLKVYGSIRQEVALVIVDGFVYLGEQQKGLGAHLFVALGSKIPVIGVAKTYFRGAGHYAKVFRGQSKKPLYVSSIGVELECAVQLIGRLKGSARIPEALKRVDQLTRQ